MENTGNTLIALLTGAIVGAGVALLYAPDKGENTRRKLNDGAMKAKTRFDQQLRETTDRLSKKARKAKSSFDAKLEETLSSASYKADDIIVALEGKLEELRAKNAKLHKEAKSSGNNEELTVKSKSSIA